MIVHEGNSDDEVKNFDITDAHVNDDGESSLKSHKSNLMHSDSTGDSEMNYDTFIEKFKGNLECCKCHEQLPTYSKLEEHFKTSHPVNKFIIICCKNKFYERWKLIEHLLAVHNKKCENAFKCETCSATFTLNGNLRRHMRRKHALQPILKWSCVHCMKVFRTRLQLDAHKNKIHNVTLEQNKESSDDSDIGGELKEILMDSSSHSSEVVNYNENTVPMKNLQNLEQHPYNNQLDIKQERSYKKDIEKELSALPTPTNRIMQIQVPPLDICDIKNEILTDTESNTDEANATQRNKSHNELNIDDNKFHIVPTNWKGFLKCPKCMQNIKSYPQLEDHFATDHPDELCYLNCCHIVFNERSSIIEHFRFHENPKAFECDNCGKCFTNTRGLSSHKLQVHSEHRSAYHLHLCYCKKAKKLAEMYTKEQLLEYNTIVCCPRKKKILDDDAFIAQWKNEHTCEICKATFPFYSLMRTHFYHEHPGEKYCITCCQRKLSRISDALEHIRFHLDPHAYRCKICETTFSGKGCLAKHMRNVHIDSLPKHKWACDKCDKTFQMRQILIRHKNVYHSKQA